MVYIKSDKDLAVEMAVQSYLQLQQCAPSKTQLQLALNKIFLSVNYLADRYTKKYFFDSNRSDLKQSFYECVLKALETYDPEKSDSFRYWLDLYTIKMKRAAVKVVIDHKMTTSLDYKQEDLSDGLMTPDPNFSPEQLCIIKQSIENLCPSDYELLMIWLDSDSFEDAAWKINISKQAVHSRITRIMEKVK